MRYVLEYAEVLSTTLNYAIMKKHNPESKVNFRGCGDDLMLTRSTLLETRVLFTTPKSGSSQ